VLNLTASLLHTGPADAEDELAGPLVLPSS